MPLLTSFLPDAETILDSRRPLGRRRKLDATIRLWPVPDVTKTPPHKRSHEEFLAILHSWTNVQAVPDSNSSTGFELEAGPFSGWQNPPHW